MRQVRGSWERLGKAVLERALEDERGAQAVEFKTEASRRRMVEEARRWLEGDGWRLWARAGKCEHEFERYLSDESRD